MNTLPPPPAPTVIRSLNSDDARDMVARHQKACIEFASAPNIADRDECHAEMIAARTALVAALVVQPVQPTPSCPHKDEPRGCNRIRCQLGKVCVEPSPAAIAYLLTRPSGFSWAAVPREISPVLREMLLKDNVKIEPLYAHSAPAATLSDKLDALLERAHVEHQVITVDLIPREPFAMGSYSMCGSIRPGRVS